VTAEGRALSRYPFQICGGERAASADREWENISFVEFRMSRLKSKFAGTIIAGSELEGGTRKNP